MVADVAAGLGTLPARVIPLRVVATIPERGTVGTLAPQPRPVPGYPKSGAR